MAVFVSAVVLAAGMSSRMGTPKQLIKIGERTLLQITLEAIRSSDISETILVLGHEADTIRKVAGIDSSTKTILNPSYTEGISTSIKAGLRAVSADSAAALIVLADQPLLQPAVLNALITAYEQTGSAIVVPVYRGFRGNPVLIARFLFPEMLNLSGDIGCRSLFGLYPEQIHKVEVDDIGILVDIDTKEDLARLGSKEDLLGGVQWQDRVVPEAVNKELIVVGGDEVARSLAKLASILKFRVTVLDPLLTQTQIPEADRIFNELKINATKNSAIVIASRGRFDEEALEQAVRTDAWYIALVGSRKRGAELLQALRSKGVSKDALQRIHSPAGVQIHASTPEETALSIVAEIVSEMRSSK